MSTEYDREYRATHREEIAAYQRAYYAAHQRERQEAIYRHRGKQPDTYWRVYNWKRLGIPEMTIKRYEELLSAQNGKCLNCGTDVANQLGHRLHVDHDHETGELRGLLCMQCNLKDALATPITATRLADSG